jgi:hypothetical protein
LWTGRGSRTSTIGALRGFSQCGQQVGCPFLFGKIVFIASIMPRLNKNIRKIVVMFLIMPFWVAFAAIRELTDNIFKLIHWIAKSIDPDFKDIDIEIKDEQ